jgi:hypothetical protein
MAKPALAECEDMPSHPNAPKKVNARQHGTNSFVRGGGKKGKGKRGRKHVTK